MNTWLVRTGSRQRAFSVADDCWRLQCIAVSWSDWLDGDLRDKDENQIVDALLASHPSASAGSIGAHRRQLMDFRDNIRIGDLVISPDWRSERLMVGTITGDYDYRPDLGLESNGLIFRHVHPVDWSLKIRRDGLPAREQRALNLPPTIYSPTHFETILDLYRRWVA